MSIKIIDGKIWSSEIDKWVDLNDFLTNIVNTAAEVVNHPMTMKFVSAMNSRYGARWQYPTIDTFTIYKSEDVCKALNDIGIPAEVDLYEDEDGDDEYGAPIIRRIWSVQIPSLKITEDVPARLHSTNITEYKFK